MTHKILELAIPQIPSEQKKSYSPAFLSLPFFFFFLIEAELLVLIFPIFFQELSQRKSVGCINLHLPQL